MSAAPVRMGLVGCGRIAERSYLPALMRIPGLELVAVADPDRVRRERLAGTARAHRSLAELLGGSTVEALVLATPAEAHLADARRAAAHGIPTLVEKPPAPDAASAAELARLRPAPSVGLNRRFDPGVALVRAAIAASGREAAELRLDLRYRRTGWRAHQAADDALLDLGPHLVDLARVLSRSEVVAVRCNVARRSRADLELELRGCRALLRCATDRPWRESLEVRDRRGREIARHRLGGVRGAAGRVLSRLPGTGRLDSAPLEHPLVDSIARQLESFAARVRGEPAPLLATAADGAAAMAALEAARRSAARGGLAESPAPESGAPPFTVGVSAESTEGARP